MSGTDSSRPAALGGGPAIILVEPQLGENIGAAARAMLNCGLTELRLVRPRDGWPNPKAQAMAAGADRVIDHARLFDSTAAAIADLRRVYATTARPRGLVKPVVTPRRAAAELRAAIGRDEPCGVLFGPERSGLTNDDVVLAGTVIAVPLNPAFASLNLAQAVLLVGYEWFQAGEGEAAPAPNDPGAAATPATQADLLRLFTHLEDELDAADFFPVAEKRPSMVRNLRSLFTRTGLTEQEVGTLHGVVTALSGRRLGGKPRGRG